MRNRSLLILILLIAILLPINMEARAAESPAPSFQQADIVPGELIVIMKAGKSVGALTLPEKARHAAKKHKGLEKLDAGVVNVPAGEESAYISKIKKGKDVLVVEPNYKVSADFIPDDTYYASQYSLPLIQAPLAWDVATGSSSVIIAIIDSGLDSTHPEFAGRIVPGYDFIQNDSTPQDECGHGTHVAGIAAAAGNNAQGIAGIAWGVKIMPLRMLDGGCGGSFADMADALVWAADHGAKIINLSVGSPSPSTLMENATYYAYSHGAAIFAAAGNDGVASVSYPAAYPWVMAVGATDSINTRAGFSNYGTALDLMAPGVGVYSTMPMQSGFLYNTAFGKSPQYDFLSGTSMASPHAAGAAALLASMPCFDTPDKIYQALTSTALDLGAAGRDDSYGYGLIQIADAMKQCPVIVPPNPFAIEYDLVNSNTCNNLAQYNWRDASGGTSYVFIPGGDSGYTPLLTLPFTFNFGGSDYTDLRVHTNGYITLGNDVNNRSGTDGNFMTNFTLPTGAYPNNFIAPFWDDLTDNSAAGRVYTDTYGSAPNREFVIEYSGFQRVGVPTSNLNFEVILFEGSNQIKMQYRALSGAGADGSSATVGLEYGDTSIGFAGYEYAYNKVGALQNGLALLFFPYASGTPSLPSDSSTPGLPPNSGCPQTQAVTVEKVNDHPCEADPATFDVDIFAGALPYRSALKVQQLASAPAMPASFLDLQHYADINLRYSPPAPVLYPMPQVKVCYAYTAQDLLAAGGHPENLFIAAHDISTSRWSALPTTVDPLNPRLFALAPHFSYYGVATLNPTLNKKSRLGLPVTGAPLSNDLIFFLIFIGVIFLSNRIWLRKKIK